MAYRLGVLLGDDIGPEVVPEAVRVSKAALKAAGVEVEWIDLPIGWQAYETLGNTMPDGTLERLSELDGWILGPIGHQAYPKEPNSLNPHPVIRKHFDLFANLRPARSYATIPTPFPGVDMLIVRENNEGFQPDRNMFAGSGEFMPDRDMAISVRVITRKACERLARVAFENARRRKRHVTAVHKDTVFKMSCGLFAEVCQGVAREYPDVAYDEVLVDTFGLKMVMNPRQFDVIAITNMFGDIMSDVAGGLVGGMGLAPALQMGPAHAMAQAAHGSAPDIAGKGIANPFAEIMSMKMLLAWLGETRSDTALAAAAKAIEGAVDEAIADGNTLTPDLGGNASTQEMGAAIAGLVPGHLAA
ncbi:MAG: isocitrate/isopropylmalate dehydrogenase family protein [Proteobacteria bacterium]|nr:isocitrate/isopropylmalate dehydrogenase family protein [Pseudomonadota bacterium]